jgi:hypothetical protein
MQILAFNWNSIEQPSNTTIMIVEDKKKDKEEKEWENPTSPDKTSDDRDKEQLLRQYKEAKRRHDNLTDAEDNETKTEH